MSMLKFHREILMILLKDQRRSTQAMRRKSGFTTIMRIWTIKLLPDVKRCGRLTLRYKRLEALSQDMLVVSTRTIIIKFQKNALEEKQFSLFTTLVKSLKTLIFRTFLICSAYSIAFTISLTTSVTSNNGCMISVPSASTTIASQNNFSKMKWELCSKLLVHWMPWQLSTMRKSH